MKTFILVMLITAPNGDFVDRKELHDFGGVPMSEKSCKQAGMLSQAFFKRAGNPLNLVMTTECLETS